MAWGGGGTYWGNGVLVGGLVLLGLSVETWGEGREECCEGGRGDSLAWGQGQIA